MSAATGASTRPGGDAGGLHRLEGASSVDQSARLIRHYRYAVERMMRILGGWIALTPELSAKLLLGRHVWDSAQHADALGRRLPELRAQAQMSEPANGAFVAFMNAIEAPEQPDQTVERLVGVYRVLKPHLIASYEDHLRRINRVYEPPTERILARLVEDERRHVAAGSTILRHLTTTPGLADRGEAWQSKLEDLLGKAGGVTGAGLPTRAQLANPSSTVALNDDPRELIRLEQSPTRWSMPEALGEALTGFGAALIARDQAQLATWLVPELLAADAPASLAGLGPETHRVVAFAKIGEKRVVKLRLDGVGAAGPRGAVALLTRWIPTADGWRVEAVDPLGLDPLPPT